MIILKDIHKEIKGKSILQNVSLTFQQGNVYLLKGHNGSGKTMLLRLLCDLLKPTSGTIEKPDYTYGVMIENPSFIEHETARANLRYLASIQKKISPADIEVSLKAVNLLDAADWKVKRYSLGMKQRLAFCQAIMENPDVLLLDEPFNALDDENMERIIELLNQLKKDKIIVIAAHGINGSDMSLFDEVITMNDGCIKEVDTLSYAN